MQLLVKLQTLYEMFMVNICADFFDIEFKPSIKVLKQHFFILFLIFSWFYSTTILAQNTAESDTLYNVSEVVIEGLKKTKDKHCAKFLNCFGKTGNFHKQMIKDDIQTLWNMGLFSQVLYTTEQDENGQVKLIFKVQEKFYYLPIIGLDLSQENVKLTLGAFGYNILGNGTLLSATYQWYDRHSVDVRFANPYLFNDKWGAEVQFARWATVEPTQVYQNSLYKRDNDFEVTKWNAGALVYYSPKFRNTIYLGGNYLKERYLERLTLAEIEDEEITGIDFNIPKFLLKAGWQLNKVNYFYQYVDGWYFFTEFANVLPDESVNQTYFWKWENQVKYFKRICEKHNLALRGIVGLSTNEPMPFPAFVQDDYVNLRGVGDRVGRGTAEFSFNSEWRSTIFDWKNAAIMTNVYLDASTLRPIDGNWRDLFQKNLTHITTGVGLRLFVSKFYSGVFRIDYGFDILNPKQHGLVMGLGHYF